VHPIHEIRVQYLMATPDALCSLMQRSVVTMDLLAGVSGPGGLSPGSTGLGRANVHFDRLGIVRGFQQVNVNVHAAACARTRRQPCDHACFSVFMGGWLLICCCLLCVLPSPQERLDFVVPIATEEFGMTGLSLSVGVVCDGPATLPGHEAYVVLLLTFPCTRAYPSCGSHGMACAFTFTCAWAWHDLAAHRVGSVSQRH
jgi:hypothetical protein